MFDEAWSLKLEDQEGYSHVVRLCHILGVIGYTMSITLCHFCSKALWI